MQGDVTAVDTPGGARRFNESPSVIDRIAVGQVLAAVAGYTSSISMPNSRKFSLSSS